MSKDDKDFLRSLVVGGIFLAAGLLGIIATLIVGIIRSSMEMRIATLLASGACLLFVLTGRYEIRREEKDTKK